ncbi:MAG TPA: class I SAM-dependent methyltransferase [Planctomycetota bacterium]|nr:class I SAM-dependent methyltransferase [Planctomycetota bacterium]
MIDATHRFDDRAEDYALYRPGYARDLVPRLAAERGLPPGAHVADVGCGTGLLARSFLDAGCRVTGVEPSDPMRAQAVAQLGGRPGFACHAGTAEASGLPDASVDAVVAGQAFHWFDVERARAEFLRVLRPGGWVALVWNDRGDLSQPFLARFDALLVEHCPDYTESLRGPPERERAEVFFGAGRADAGALRELRLPNPQSLDWTGVEGRTRSASYVPRSGPAHDALFAQLRELFGAYARGGRVGFGLTTLVFHGTLAP